VLCDADSWLDGINSLVHTYVCVFLDFLYCCLCLRIALGCSYF